ncbi:serine protease HtrA [Bacillus luti]|nr:serine protease [Bacillus cereus]
MKKEIILMGFVSCFGVLLGGGMVYYFEVNKPPVVQTIIKSDVEDTQAIRAASSLVVGVVAQTEKKQHLGVGSGVIYKNENGYAWIVTNQHVIDKAGIIEVRLENGETFEASLLGSDVFSDLAVLKIKTDKKFHVSRWRNSDTVMQGETVYAIGNPLGLDLQGTITKGIISAKKREMPVDLDEDGEEDWVANVLQTDAAINPGNSGGALFDRYGQMVGINSMKISKEEVEGIGFAIPVEEIRPVLNMLETYGQVKRPYLGIEVESVKELHEQGIDVFEDGSVDGVIVTQVNDGSVALKSNLREGDVLIKFGKYEVENRMTFRQAIYKYNMGDVVKVEGIREGVGFIVEVQL